MAVPTEPGARPVSLLLRLSVAQVYRSSRFTLAGAAALTAVIALRWLSVPRFDFDTELCLLVPLSRGAPAIWVTHGLLPALVRVMSAALPPLAALLLLAAAALFALMAAIGESVRRATRSSSAACLAQCLCASALCVRTVVSTADDNLFPLPLLAAAVACLAAGPTLQPGRHCEWDDLRIRRHL